MPGDLQVGGNRYGWRVLWVGIFVAAIVGFQIWQFFKVDDIGDKQAAQADQITRIETTIQRNCNKICQVRVADLIITRLEREGQIPVAQNRPGGQTRSSVRSGASTGSDSSSPSEESPTDTPADTPSSPTSPAPGGGGDQPNPDQPDNPGVEPGPGDDGPQQTPHLPLLDDVGNLVGGVNEDLQHQIDHVDQTVCQTVPQACQ